MAILRSIFNFYSAHYVPNVAKRSTWEQCICEDRRPTDLAVWETSNGHISATGHPIHFIFGSRVRFSRGRWIEWRYTCGFRKSKMAAGRRLRKCRMAIFLQRVMKFTSRLVLWQGFRLQGSYRSSIVKFPDFSLTFPVMEWQFPDLIETITLSHKC